MADATGKIVIVDDESSVLEMMEDLLKDQVEEIRATTDSREVVNLLQGWNADVLVTDLQMPNMNGTELIETIRKGGSELEIVVISSFATQASRDELQKHLVGAVLDKPGGFKELSEVVAKLVERKRQRKSAVSPGENAKVLVVDDHETIRDLVREVCEEQGFDVTVAGDGREAYEQAVGRDFQLIFMDIHMPNMDGIEAIEKIRKANPTAFIVSMTGEAGFSEQEQTKLAGAYTCLKKPFTIEALTDIVERFGLISAHRQKFHLHEQKRRDEVAIRRAEEAAKPLVEKLGKDLRRQGLSWGVLTAIFVGATAVALLAVAILYSSISAVSDKVQELDTFMGRVEGYLERDEQRELEGGPRNPRP